LGSGAQQKAREGFAFDASGFEMHFPGLPFSIGHVKMSPARYVRIEKLCDRVSILANLNVPSGHIGPMDYFVNLVRDVIFATG
jgi:hypothetical protein